MKRIETLKLLFIIFLLVDLPKKINSEYGLNKENSSSNFHKNLLNIYDDNPIKDGIFTSITQNGPLVTFSFQEKEEIKRFSDIENYFPKKVKNYFVLLFREEKLKTADFVLRHLSLTKKLTSIVLRPEHPMVRSRKMSGVMLTLLTLTLENGVSVPLFWIMIESELQI